MGKGVVELWVGGEGWGGGGKGGVCEGEVVVACWARGKGGWWCGLRGGREWGLGVGVCWVWRGGEIGWYRFLTGFFWSF